MLELGLAVAILALLIVVAVASVYDHQASKTKRQVAHRMQEVADWLHLQKANQGTYEGVLPVDWSSSQEGSPYTISLVRQPVEASDPKTTFPAIGPESFTLQAVPQGAEDCGILLLDQSGRRGVTGLEGSVADCWE